MRANPFESQLERLARTLTEQFGVHVVCQGDNAWTDGRQIVLPSVPEPMDEGLERMMVGYLDHEMAHVAFSDFKVVERFVKKYPGREGMLNVVEDALIERRAMQRWPGVRHNLDMMFEQIKDKVAQLIQQRGPFERFCTAVYLQLSHHNDLMGLQGELAGYDDLLARFPQITNTNKAGELAGLMLERWQQRAPQHPQQQQQSNQTGTPKKGASKTRRSSSARGNEQGRSNEGAGDSHTDSDQATDDGATDGDCKDQPATSRGESATTGKRTSAHGASTPPQQTDPADSTAAGEATSRKVVGGAGTGGRSGSLIGEALVSAISEAIRQTDSSREYRVFTKSHDRIEVLPYATDNEVRALMEIGKDTVRRLRRGLTNALRSAEKRWWRDDQTRGNLSPRTLYRLVTDRSQLDIFRVRSVIQGQSTAVSMLLDASGSMTSRKMDVARQAIRALLESLDELRIPTEAVTFTTGDAVDISRVCKTTDQDASKLRERYGRLANLEIGLIKGFEESAKTALRRLPGIRGTGLTPLGEAMQIGAARLVLRPENRKILLVLTDGKAGCEGSGEAATAHAQHVAKLITGAAIELVGVGILDDSVCTIVKDSIVIHELTDLPAQLCKLLGRTLKKGVAHVG